MATDIVMPHMGESVAEGTILAWLKKPGDAVATDEPVVEIATDKINVEVPASAPGVLLAILANVGDKVQVNQRIGVIGQPGEKAEEGPSPQAAAPAKVAAAVRRVVAGR